MKFNKLLCGYAYYSKLICNLKVGSSYGTATFCLLKIRHNWTLFFPFQLQVISERICALLLQIGNKSQPNHKSSGNRSPIWGYKWFPPMHCGFYFLLFFFFIVPYIITQTVRCVKRTVFNFAILPVIRRCVQIFFLYRFITALFASNVYTDLSYYDVQMMPIVQACLIWYWCTYFTAFRIVFIRHLHIHSAAAVAKWF